MVPQRPLKISSTGTCAYDLGHVHAHTISVTYNHPSSFRRCRRNMQAYNLAITRLLLSSASALSQACRGLLPEPEPEPADGAREPERDDTYSAAEAALDECRRLRVDMSSNAIDPSMSRSIRADLQLGVHRSYVDIDDSTLRSVTIDIASTMREMVSRSSKDDEEICRVLQDVRTIRDSTLGPTAACNLVGVVAAMLLSDGTVHELNSGKPGALKVIHATSVVTFEIFEMPKPSTAASATGVQTSTSITIPLQCIRLWAWATTTPTISSPHDPEHLIHLV